MYVICVTSLTLTSTFPFNRFLEFTNVLPINETVLEVIFVKILRKMLPALIIIMLAFLIVPVLADSPKKITVTISKPITSITGVPDPDAWTNEGGIRHVRGEILNFGVYQVKQGTTVLFGGSAVSVADYNFNVNTQWGAGVSKIVVTLPSGDTFEGKQTSYGTFKVATSGGTQGVHVVSQGILQGTGEYRGWTLQYFSETGQPTEAYLLIP